jgi:hypothetical protein
VAEQIYGQQVTIPANISPELIASARAVFNQAVDEGHIAWARLCRRAFSALPLEERRDALPLALDQLPRIWGVAPQICRSLEALLIRSDGGRELVDLVSQRLSDHSSTLPDYAATWLLHAFRWEEWEGRELLALLDGKLKSTLSAARRELLVALRGTAAARMVTYETEDPWQARAHIWATGEWSDEKLRPNDSENKQEWEKSLYEALTE